VLATVELRDGHLHHGKLQEKAAEWLLVNVPDVLVAPKAHLYRVQFDQGYNTQIVLPRFSRYSFCIGDITSTTVTLGLCFCV
jgi:hypothetical protein